MSRIKEIEGRLKKATPGPWVWGEWTIFDEDRPAQKRGERYWTLVDDSYSSCLCKGPLGRKSRDIECVASGAGYEESDINVSEADAAFIAHAPQDIEYLLSLVWELAGALDNALIAFELDDARFYFKADAVRKKHGISKEESNAWASQLNDQQKARV